MTETECKGDIEDLKSMKTTIEKFLEKYSNCPEDKVVEFKNSLMKALSNEKGLENLRKYKNKISVPQIRSDEIDRPYEPADSKPLPAGKGLESAGKGPDPTGKDTVPNVKFVKSGKGSRQLVPPPSFKGGGNSKSKDIYISNSKKTKKKVMMKNGSTKLRIIFHKKDDKKKVDYILLNNTYQEYNKKKIY